MNCGWVQLWKEWVESLYDGLVINVDMLIHCHLLPQLSTPPKRPPAMPLSDPEDLSDAEKNYRESSDEDFNPTSAPADESSSSSEDEAPEKPAKGKRKRKVPATDGLDSGDEATIEAAQKKKAKKHKGGEDSDEDEDDLMFSDDGGEGGLIKTRAQRKVE